MGSLGFSVYNVISSANRNSFTSSFLTLVPFIYLSCLAAVVRTSNSILNKSDRSRLSCLIPDFREKKKSFSLLNMILAVGFSYLAFIMLRYVPSILTFLGVFIISTCWILSNAFSASIKIMILIVHFVNVVYHIDWFADIEPSLYTWNKSLLIMVYDPFNVLLKSVC